MRITEIFFSIQGEGELTGVPSVFIRTAGCNLRCGWCDTRYASWEPTGDELSIDEIIARVTPHPTRFVVITGGEPMIAPGIHNLTARLAALGTHITIETSGTVLPAGVDCHLASLSPKLSNSRPAPDTPGGWYERHERTRLAPATITEWLSKYPYQLKFVGSSLEDADEIRDLLGRLGTSVPPEKVLLMPEGINEAQLRGHGELVIDLCKQHGWRYCDRLHIRLFGSRRGV